MVMLPLLTLLPVVVVLRLMVDAVMVVLTSIDAVVGVVPAAVPFVLTLNAFHVPETEDSVSVLLDTSCRFTLLVPAPVVVRAREVAPAVPFSRIRA